LSLRKNPYYEKSKFYLREDNVNKRNLFFLRDNDVNRSAASSHDKLLLGKPMV
jgi:hypothetical protein